VVILNTKQRKDKFQHYFWRGIGLAFIITGLNDTLRTYCLDQANSIHGAVHACILFTAPLAYLGAIMIVVIGLLIFFMEEIISKYAKGDK
jgi:hypothetical protein